MHGAAVSLCCGTDGAGSDGDGGVGVEASEGDVGVEEISAGGGVTGSTGGAGRSVEGEAGIVSSGLGGDPVDGIAASGSDGRGGGVLGGAGLSNTSGVSVGGVIGRGGLWSSSYSRKSSNSQRLFRAFFTGGGAVSDGFLAGIDGDAWRSGRGVGVAVAGSVWTLIEFVLVTVLPRFRRR
jgi:hypothetical protein